MKGNLSLNGLMIVAILLLAAIIIALIPYTWQKIRQLDMRRLDRALTVIQPYLLLVFFLSFIGCTIGFTIYFSRDFLPGPVSEHGQAIVPLFLTTTVVTGTAFFLTQVSLFLFSFIYRTQPGKKAVFLKGNLKLELFWIIAPALMFLFLFVWGQVLWADIQSDPNGNVLELDVMGAQYTWRVRYPGADGQLGRAGFRHISRENDMGIDFSDPNSRDDFVPVQMHIPKGTPVRLFMRSRDVIHSFFIPHLRLKQDAVPGMTVKVHFTANTTTAEMRKRLNDPDFNYEIGCAELCGRMHFAMKMILVIDEPEDFEKWYREQQSWLALHPDYANLYTEVINKGQ